jgi:Domain of unknown function (DUF4365)
MKDTSQLPKRPASHVTGERAIFALKEALPAHWIVREVSEDYGIDCEIEIVNEHSSVTGAIIKAQVKGTSSADVSSQESVSVRLATVRYWLAIPVPVILVRVIGSPKKVLWLDVRDYLRATRKLKSIYTTEQKTITFNFANSQLLSNSATELNNLALSHQFAIEQWRRHLDIKPIADWVGLVLLFGSYDGDPNKWLKWMREHGSDEQIANDYAFVLWLKEESDKDPSFIPRLRSLFGTPNNSFNRSAG